MSKFVTLRYRDDDVEEDLVINLDHISNAYPDIRMIVMTNRNTYTLTEPAWKVLEQIMKDFTKNGEKE